jgi:hypothetical protein
VTKPVRDEVAALRRRYGIADRRSVKPELAREEQLALAV